MLSSAEQRSSGKNDFMLLLRKSKTYGPRNQTRSEATLNSLSLAIATLAKVEVLKLELRSSYRTASKGSVKAFAKAKVWLLCSLEAKSIS